MDNAQQHVEGDDRHRQLATTTQLKIPVAVANGTQTLYEILGVEQNASADQIKRAFRCLALKFHPDKARGDGSDNGGAETEIAAANEEMFKAITFAYEVLSDPANRRVYDICGLQGVQVRELLERTDTLFTRATKGLLDMFAWLGAD